MKIQLKHNVGCEIACKIDDILEVTKTLLRGNDLTRLQAQMLEKMIAELSRPDRTAAAHTYQPLTHRFSILITRLISRVSKMLNRMDVARGT